MVSSNHSPQISLNLSWKGLAVNPRNLSNTSKVTWNSEVTWVTNNKIDQSFESNIGRGSLQAITHSHTGQDGILGQINGTNKVM